MFQNFDDYDGYAFYSASRLFFAFKNNLKNGGSVVKGKVIKPIKSCLNYTKRLLYPMKIEYQRQAYAQDFYMETINDKFDSFAFTEKLKNAAQEDFFTSTDYKAMVIDTFKSIHTILEQVLQDSPFKPGSLDYKHLRISILLTCLHSLNQKNKLDFKINSALFWKLPRSMSSFVQFEVREFLTKFKAELMMNYNQRLDDNIINFMISNPTGEFKSNNEEKY